MRGFAGEEESNRNRCSSSWCVSKRGRGRTESHWLTPVTGVWCRNQLQGGDTERRIRVGGGNGEFKFQTKV